MFTGSTLHEVQNQAFLILRAPWYQPGNDYGERVGQGVPSVEMLETTYSNLPNEFDKRGPKVKASEVPLLADSELDPATYAKKHNFAQFLTGKGRANAATAAMLWGNYEKRILLCSRKLRGEPNIVITAEVNKRFNESYNSEEILAFFTLFWDTSQFSPQELLELVGGSPQISAVPKKARQDDDEIRRKLGLVTREENNLRQIQYIKDYAFDAIELLRLTDPMGVKRGFSNLANLYFLTMKEEATAKEAQTMIDRLAEDTDDNRISVIKERAIPQFEQLLYPQIAAAQRKEELEFARKEGILSDDEYNSLIARLDQGDDIGIGVRELINQYLEKKELPSEDLIDEL